MLGEVFFVIERAFNVVVREFGNNQIQRIKRRHMTKALKIFAIGGQILPIFTYS